MGRRLDSTTLFDVNDLVSHLKSRVLRPFSIGVSVLLSLAAANLLDPNSLPRWQQSIEHRVGNQLLETGEFSDAMAAGSGATGWVALIPVFLLGFACSVLEQNPQQISAVIVLCNATCLFLAMSLVTRQDPLLFAIPVSLVLIMGFGCNRLLRFQPEMLCIPFISFVLCSDRQTCDTSLTRSIRYFDPMARCFAILISPVVGLALLAHSLFRFRNAGKIFIANKKFVISACLAIAVVIPWSIRNSRVVGLPGFVKTNGWYEIFQSQVLDNDGVLDSVTLKQHPLSENSLAHRQYMAMGEAEFLSQTRDLSVDALASEPLEYLNRAGNRLIAVLLGSFVFSAPLHGAHVFQLVVFCTVHLLILIYALCHEIRSPEFDRAIILLGLIALPYILVSFYERYRLVFYPPVYAALSSAFNDFADRRSGVRHDVVMTSAGGWSSRRTGFTLTELLVCLAILSIVISLLLTSVQNARDASRRVQCKHRMRQVCLAVQPFHSTFGHIPGNGGPVAGNGLSILGASPGTKASTHDLVANEIYEWGVADPSASSRRQPGSWGVQLLPFLEMPDVFSRLDTQAVVSDYICVGRSRGDVAIAVDDRFGRYRSGEIAMAKTDISANRFVSRNFPEIVAFRDIRDGLSVTVCFG